MTVEHPCRKVQHCQVLVEVNFFLTEDTKCNLCTEAQLLRHEATCCITPIRKTFRCTEKHFQSTKRSGTFGWNAVINTHTVHTAYVLTKQGI